MRPISVLFVLLLAVPLLAVSSDAPALLGVELGSTHIRTAYFNDTGPVPLVSIIGSQGYQDYMADTLKYEGPPQYIRDSRGVLVRARDENHNLTAAVLMFQQALTEAVERSRHAVEEFIGIGTIGIPNHLNDTSRNAVSMALGAFHPEFETNVRVRFSDRLALLTYPHHNCLEQFGHEDYTTDWADNDWVMLVDQSFGRAQAIMAEVMPWGPAYDATDTVVASGIKDLIKQGIPELIKRERSHIQAIVLSGNISASEATAVEQVVRTKFPELLDKMQGTDSKSAREYVKAIGAACSARGLERHPEFIEGLYEDHGFRLSEDQHDEL